MGRCCTESKCTFDTAVSISPEDEKVQHRYMKMLIFDVIFLDCVGERLYEREVTS